MAHLTTAQHHMRLANLNNQTPLELVKELTKGGGRGSVLQGCLHRAERLDKTPLHRRIYAYRKTSLPVHPRLPEHLRGKLERGKTDDQEDMIPSETRGETLSLHILTQYRSVFRTVTRNQPLESSTSSTLPDPASSVNEAGIILEHIVASESTRFIS